MADLVLFGDGGHARSIADVADRCGRSIVAVVRDGGAAGEPAAWHASTLRSDAEGVAYAVDRDLSVLVAIGDSAARERVQRDVAAARCRVDTLVAATSTVSLTATLGPGTVVFEHAHVGPGAVLGDGVVVNTGAVIEHDCTVGSWVLLGPGAVLTGGVVVGPGALIGAGSVVLPGLEIGAGARVGAGAVVTGSVSAGVTVRGNPARA